MFWNKDDNNSGEMYCKNELNLCKLCVKKIKAEHLWVENFKSEDICADSLKAKHLTVEDEAVNNLCVSNKLSANKIESLSLSSNNLCAQDAVINKLCVNDLTMSGLKVCQKYVASATMSSDKLYSLGTNVDWDLVLNDPNGNVSLAPFSYTVPVSGYYDFSYYLNIDKLSGSSLITGTPVGVMTVQVNGLELRKSNAPFLSFAGLQYTVISSLVKLNAGDVIRMKYEVLVLDPVSGLMSYPGTVVIKSTGALPVLSGFDIHYLSSADCTPSGTCVICPPVTIDCPTVEVDCKNQPAGSDESCGPCR